jgi:glycerate-2-kinase
MAHPRGPLTFRDPLNAILRAAISAADPEAAVRSSLILDDSRLLIGDLEVDLGASAVWVVGAGKATAAMARGALEVLGERVAGGSITIPQRTHAPAGLDVWEGGHPIPDVGGLAGAAEALHLARSLGKDDLLLCLLSGGASALWSAPADGITLGELRETTDALLRGGMPIEEVNVVRKHLSRLAGGRLARAAAPARVLTLAVADVVAAGDDSIGSGPTLPDPSSFEDALALLRRYDLRLPGASIHHLQSGATGMRSETVKPGELNNLLGFHRLLDVRDALAGAASAAASSGYRPVIVDESLQGEASTVGLEIAEAALRARRESSGPTALLWGGETTVTVRGEGRGGRNQELALAAAIGLAGKEGIVLAALATDGRDGPTDAAGAIVDGLTRARGRDAGLDADGFLRANDSYHFLDATGSLLRTGETGTNVNDLVVVLVD